MFFSLSKKDLKQKISDYIIAVYRKNISRPLELIWSFFTGTLAFICLLLIFSYTPVISTAQTIISFTFQNESGPLKETFAFVPGSVSSKFDEIDLDNLSFLAFYDLPFDTDGSLIQETDGYNAIQSDEAFYMFQSAKNKGVKVLAALTQTYNQDILAFLDNQNSWQNLFEQSAQKVRDTGIDGVTLNIEFTGDSAPEYKTKYNNFVRNFTEYMHNNVKDSIVTVAVPNNYNENSIYDTGALALSSDKTLIVAYDFAVPENNEAKLISPIYAGSKIDYQKNINSVQLKFQNKVPENKLVIERAWYGNGDNYPLYSKNYTPQAPVLSDSNTLNTKLSAYTVDKLISDVPQEARSAVRKNLPFIINALANEKILNANVLSYALATIQHETAGTFEPIDEIKGRKHARRLGYEGGTNYFGRGFIQLTHLRNYEKIGQRIGIGDSLVKNPELASDPEIAAKILAAYFKDYGIAELAESGNFIDARTPINPDYNGYMIAQIAYVYLNAFI